MKEEKLSADTTIRELGQYIFSMVREEVAKEMVQHAPIKDNIITMEAFTINQFDSVRIVLKTIINGNPIEADYIYTIGELSNVEKYYVTTDVWITNEVYKRLKEKIDKKLMECLINTIGIKI
jgi:hypothetical protein